MRRLTTALLAALTLLISSCHHEEYRIPPYPVRITFVTIGDWVTYGIGGASDYRYFTLENPRQPSGFPYAVNAATGYGGVLLVGDIMGTPKAYDMACPVEVKRDVRIYVDKATMKGVCPKCGSTYEVFEVGQPLSGEAAQNGWYLRPYSVNILNGATEYARISN